MTYKEKLAMEHPNAIDEGRFGGCNGCPSDYGYCDVHHQTCPYEEPSIVNCEKCWNRNIEKENNTMNDEKVCDLISEIEKKNEEIDRLIREKEALIEETERSKQKDELRDACVLINEHINAMVDGGFTREEAFAIFTKFLEKMI